MPSDCAAMPMRPPSRLDERDAIALPFRAEHQIGGQFHVLEDELRGVGGALPELVLEPRDPVAGRVGRHDKGADAPCGRRSGSVTAKTIATSAVEPEVMNCLVPLSTQRLPWRARAGLDRGGVGAGLRLGQAEAGEHLALRHRLQKPLFLLLASRSCSTGMQPTELCTLRIVETAPSPAAISSIASA